MGRLRRGLGLTVGTLKKPLGTCPYGFKTCSMLSEVRRRSRNWLLQLRNRSLHQHMYLCDLRSNMCNSSFHSGLNPSSATLFTIRFRTTVATPLQKAAPLVRSNRFKPCCNLGLNGVSTRGSNRAAPSFQTLLQTKKHRDVTLGVCKLGLEPWFTQGGTGGAKLQHNYSHLVKMVSPNAKLTSCNPDPFSISFLRLVESKLNLVSWFSTSRSGCVQPVRIVEIRPNTAKMLGVRLDFGLPLVAKKAAWNES